MEYQGNAIMMTKNERAAHAAEKKRLRAQDSIVEAHRAEIVALMANGKKPSEIAAWLRDYGFEGTGATINGYFPWQARDYASKPEKKKSGRPRIHNNAADRVKAFRAKAGHRYDIHLGPESAGVMRVLQEQSGLSASGVIDALLRGALKVPRLPKTLPVT